MRILSRHIHKAIAWFHGSDYFIKRVKNFYRNDKIGNKEVVVVGGSDYHKWAHLACPCGCGDIINLSLMKSHEPTWSLKIHWGLPTFYPSIWKRDGCKSHFWIKKGKIKWSRF